MPAPTCSSAGAGSWMTGAATWPARVESRRPEQHSMVFPPGITVEGATPTTGGLIARHCTRRLTLAGDAPATKIRGSLPPPAPLSYCAPFRRTRGRHARRNLASLCRFRGAKSALSRVQSDVPGKHLTTTARAPPSEKEALRLLKARATQTRHRGFFGGALVCLHRIDPQRRKSLIIPRTSRAAVPCSDSSPRLR